jgi:hypothetical protein
MVHTDDGWGLYIINDKMGLPVQVKAKLSSGGKFYTIVAPNGEELIVLRHTFHKIARTEAAKVQLTPEQWQEQWDAQTEEIRQVEKAHAEELTELINRRQNLLAMKPEENSNRYS